MQQEEFRDVKGYEGLYQISNLGNVKSLSRLVKRNNSDFFIKERILKPGISSNFRKVVILNNKNKKTKLVHQLVAEAFLNHKPCGLKLVVDHIDDNYLNNKLENLQLITQRENVFKTQGKYSSKYKGVCWDKINNYWISRIRINNKRIHLGCFKTELEASEAYKNKLKTL